MWHIDISNAWKLATQTYCWRQQKNSRKNYRMICLRKGFLLAFCDFEKWYRKNWIPINSTLLLLSSLHNDENMAPTLFTGYRRNCKKKDSGTSTLADRPWIFIFELRGFGAAGVGSSGWHSTAATGTGNCTMVYTDGIVTLKIISHQPCIRPLLVQYIVSRCLC